MNKLKKQFSDLRKNTPKHIQWLLLAAAFVVVLILLTLLLTRGEEEKLENADDVAIILNIAPDTIDWGAVIVGETETETIKISANQPVKIMDVRLGDGASGMEKPQQNCTPMDHIDSDIPCSVVLTYKPTTPAQAQAVDLYIDWRGASEPDIMKNTDRVVLVLGATAPEIPEPEPVVIPDPEPVTQIEPIAPVTENDTIDSIASETIATVTEPTAPAYQQEIINDIESIAPSSGFAFDTAEQYAPINNYDSEPEYVRPPEACSDFAMPAYNLSGVQSGWIRPSGGAYYFHPFSDTECNNPTGVYNPDNGIITDINNPAQKIGTDAEHIGYITIQNGTLPQLSNPAVTKTVNKAVQLTTDQLRTINTPQDSTKEPGLRLKPAPESGVIIGTSGSAVFSSDPFDRKFVLRQYKPIPATIVKLVSIYIAQWR